MKITPEIESILRNATFNGNEVTLPQLDRSIYVKVAQVLENAGGKWNKKVKAHVFPSDPKDILFNDLDQGVSISAKQALQAFDTPAAVAAHVVSIAKVKGMRVLEPEAGTGSLVRALMSAGAKSVHCIEIDPAKAAALQEAGFFTATGDFLAVPVPAPADRFDRIVMNPPFTKNQDVAHVARAFEWLAPGGILVAIMAGNTARSPFVKLIEGKDAVVSNLPAGSFKESGTSVNTIVVTLTKAGKSQKKINAKPRPAREELKSPEFYLNSAKRHLQKSIDLLSEVEREIGLAPVNPQGELFAEAVV